MFALKRDLRWPAAPTAARTCTTGPRRPTDRSRRPRPPTDTGCLPRPRARRRYNRSARAPPREPSAHRRLLRPPKPPPLPAPAAALRPQRWLCWLELDVRKPTRASPNHRPRTRRPTEVGAPGHRPTPAAFLTRGHAAATITLPAPCRVSRARTAGCLRRPPNDPLLVTLLPNQAHETDDDPTEPLCGLSCLPPGT